MGDLRLFHGRWQKECRKQRVVLSTATVRIFSSASITTTFDFCILYIYILSNIHYVTSILKCVIVIGIYLNNEQQITIHTRLI